MKSVVLEILNGAKAKQRIWVRLGQLVYLGSTDRSDVIVESDSSLAPQHLSIGHHSAGCFIECLDPDQRMTVNGACAQRRRLHDGDVVVVGDTRLKAHISDSQETARDNLVGPPPTASAAESTAEAPEEKENAGRDDSKPETGLNVQDQNREPMAIDDAGRGWLVDAPVNAEDSRAAPNQTEEGATDASASEIQPTGYCAYQVKKLPSNVWLYAPTSHNSFPVSAALERLVAKFQPRICVNFNYVASEFKLDEPDFCLQPGLHVSSVSDQQLLDVLELNRNHDAVMAIFTELTTDELFRNLSGQAFSFGRPSIFATQVSVATHGIAVKLLHQISAILIVDAEEDWNLFSTGGGSSAWKKLGFSSAPENIAEI